MVLYLQKQKTAEQDIVVVLMQCENGKELLGQYFLNPIPFSVLNFNAMMKSVISTKF